MHASSPTALIGTGEVLHTRLRPVRNAFRYPVFFLLLPLRTLRRDGSGALPRNRFGWVSFHDRDHGDGGPDALAWFEGLLAREGVTDVDGEVWLHTFPRVLGHAFKPVSFWYGHRADGALTAVVAEVNNTFGERHCYLLRPSPGQATLAWGQTLTASKAFHVSPFCDVSGGYRFRFLRTDLAPGDTGATAPRTVARIDHDDAQGALLRTSVCGHLAPLTAATLRQAAWRMPLLTLGVFARIHWQAWRLWRARVPFFRKPAPPDQPVSREPFPSSIAPQQP